LNLTDLKGWLGFDEESDDHVTRFCERHGLEVAAGTAEDLVDFPSTSPSIDLDTLKVVSLDRTLYHGPEDNDHQSFAATIVNEKRAGLSSSQVRFN
jgi:hypothetical protein